MKILRLFKTGIRDAFKGVFRNFSLSLAAIFSIVITLLLVTASIILSANLNNITKQIEKDITIVTFMQKDATDKDVDSLKGKLEEVDNIASFTYKSKAEIKKEISNDSDVFNALLSQFDDESVPLKNVFHIKVIDVRYINDTAKTIKGFEEVSAIQYGEGMVEQLVSVFSVIEKITIGVVIAMIVVSAFLISNTIKITIYSRRTEIDIMRLVGTSNFAIRFPHLVEGFIIGALGSIIPILATIYGYTIMYSNLDGYIFSKMFLLIKPYNFVYLISFVLFIIGSLVGMIGSYRAVRKYLKI
ncbi:MAG: ABC transporter permease [Mollicutes bacterium]|jgi:cell division transport system permease protein|nr:ABC transporter permease [Mollicutes bacterium]